jgi:hypothetical protein
MNRPSLFAPDVRFSFFLPVDFRTIFWSFHLESRNLVADPNNGGNLANSSGLEEITGGIK